MTGKNPLGNGKEPQAYEGLNIVVPIGGWNLIKSVRSPTTNDKKYPIGSLWINTTNNTAWILTSAPGNWSEFAASVAGAIVSITGDTGGAESATLGNFNILGTANQIAVTGSASTETLSLIGPYTPATYTAHGVLIGEGTGSIVATTAGTNGQVFLGSTGADPAFGTLTTSTGIAFTTGAHALAINVASGGYNINAASTGVPLVAQNTYTVTQAAQASFSLPATAAVGDRFVIASALGNTSGWIITQGASQEIWANTSHTTNGATGTLAGLIHTSVELMCTVANVEFIVMGGTGLTGLTFT